MCSGVALCSDRKLTTVVRKYPPGFAIRFNSRWAGVAVERSSGWGPLDNCGIWTWVLETSDEWLVSTTMTADGGRRVLPQEVTRTPTGVHVRPNRRRSKRRREDVAQVVSELLPIAVHLPREF